MPSSKTRQPLVHGFYDRETCSIQYVAACPATGLCAIIDPVLDFDPSSGRIGSGNADAILRYVAEHGLTVEWILDTHPHADHLSAAHYLKQRTGAPMAIGNRIGELQAIWRAIYNWPDFAVDGSQWNHLFSDGETFRIGEVPAFAMASPGHTPASFTYVIGDAVFAHDTLFMPDSGTARCDFPGGSARMLWRSIQAIVAMPDATRVFTGHDYQPGGRAPGWESTVAVQKRTNLHLVGHDEDSFVALREARDSTLALPKRILHALQVNLCGGRLPPPEGNGRAYLKFPLDALG